MPLVSLERERELAAGRRVGRYTLVRRLAAGGMGTVWEVEHVTLGRRFALKLLREPRALDGPTVARFRREALALAAMEHPHIVSVVDYDSDAGAGPYLVMELLRGETLAQAMNGGPLGLLETVAWLEPVASALDAVHANGLIHRDVKPDNILRAEGPGGTSVKLVDFGLVAHADGRDRITRKGMLVGTPHYMSPEALEGATVTPASDVYSLAVVAYELLTGALPHDGDTPLALMSAKLQEPPLSLGERTGKLFAVQLERTLAEALDADPQARSASAGELIARLAALTRR